MEDSSITMRNGNGGVVTALQETDVPLGTAAQAVYRCFGAGGQLLYIGTTGHLGRRLAAHAEKIWFLEVRGMTFEWYPDEASALKAERTAIHIEQPKYNIAGRTMPRRPPPVSGRAMAAPLKPAAPSIEARRAEFARLIQSAPPAGITPNRLKSETGLGRTYIHVTLTTLCEAGVVRKIASGVYRPVDGMDVLTAMNVGQ